MHFLSLYQANASPASSPPATTPTTPARFATAAPVLCVAGADDVLEAAAELSDFDAECDADALDSRLEAEWLEERDDSTEDRAVVDGRMMPEMVVAMLKAFVGSMAGRLVCVGITSPVEAK